MLKNYNEIIPSAVWVLLVIVAAISASDFKKSKILFSNFNLVQEANNQQKLD